MNWSDFTSLKINGQSITLLLIGEDVVWTSFVVPTDCICFTAVEADSSLLLLITGTPPTGKTWLYSYNGKEWTEVSDADLSLLIITLSNVGDKYYLKSLDTVALGTSGDNYHKFVMWGKISACGELMGLVNCSDTVTSYSFKNLFQNCTALSDISKLSLSATTVGSYSCSNMFYGCTNITSTFEINATTLAGGCFTQMFRDCSKLTTGPSILPATTLANQCYYRMFQGTAISTAPELPATALATNSYGYMFYGCSSLNYINAMFTTTPSSSNNNSWVYGVASSGIFVKNINATWDVTNAHGVPSGWKVIYQNPTTGLYYQDENGLFLCDENGTLITPGTGGNPPIYTS